MTENELRHLNRRRFLEKAGLGAGGVALAGIPGLELLHDAHGHLGKVVEGQVVQGSLPQQADGTQDGVSPEALTVGDADGGAGGHGGTGV